MTMTMIRVLTLGLAVTVGGAAAAETQAPPSAQEIVATSDRARNPQRPFRMTTALVEYVGGKARDRLVLAIHSKIDEKTRQFKNLVRYTDPPRETGKMVLLAGSSMWFYDPASKASVRISAQHRLTGQASDGDVLTVNLARDYTAKLIGEEEVQDAEHQKREVWHLELTAATHDAAYSRLECWIERTTFRMVKAKLYSDSGRLLKIAYYRKFETQLGATRPSETVIIDALDTSLVTIITSSDIRAEEIPDGWFQRDYLPRFEAN